MKNFKVPESWNQYILLISLISFFCISFSVKASEKPRVIVLTDIENEPDDAMSMVRFLTYSNQWDVEGLVATTSIHQQHKTAVWRVRQIVEAYGKVRDNLLKHEPGSFTISSGRTGNPLKIEDADKVNAWFIVPESKRLGTIHLILEVTDNGIPALTRYKRVIVTVKP